MPDVYGYLFLVVYVLITILELILSFVNFGYSKKVSENPSDKVLNIFGKDLIKNAREYYKDRFYPEITHSIINTAIFVILIVFGFLQGFSSYLNTEFGNDTVLNQAITGFLFFATFSVVSFIIDLPIKLHLTFNVEKKHGFNNMTLPLLIKDTVIGALISSLLVFLLLYGAIFFIETTGEYFWLWLFGFIFLISIFLQYIFPTVLAPLFNKFEPLEDGELKDRINEVAEKAGFPLEGLYKMDASKRSNKTNAYFTGLGKKKRIVLFDTLIEKSTPQELAAVLAHEIGHFKFKHVKKMQIMSFIGMFIASFIIGLLINEEFIYRIFGFEKSVYAGLFIISIIMTPVSFITTPLFSAMSRKHEYQADKFACELTGKNDLRTALIGLAVHNKSNPVPHPLYSKFYYSHPTIMERVDAIDNLNL